jgi:hypothetical protein
MEDFTEIRKGYFKGKLDGIRAERMRTGVFFDLSLKTELDYLCALVANEQVEEEMGKLMRAQLQQLRKKISHYRKSVLIDDQFETLRDFAKRLNDVNATGERRGVRIYVDGG